MEVQERQFLCSWLRLVVVVMCCLISAVILERCRALSFDHNLVWDCVFSIHRFALVKSANKLIHVQLVQRLNNRLDTLTRFTRIARFRESTNSFASSVDNSSLEVLSHRFSRNLFRDIVDHESVVCAPVQVGHVRQDLKVTRVVQHSLNLVDSIGGELTSTLVGVDIADCHRAHEAGAESHALLLMSSGERSSCADFRHVRLNTIALAIADNLATALFSIPVDSIVTFISIFSTVSVDVT